MPSAGPQAPPEMNSCNRPGRLQEMKSKQAIGRGDCTPRNYFAFAAGAQPSRKRQQSLFDHRKTPIE